MNPPIQTAHTSAEENYKKNTYNLILSSTILLLLCLPQFIYVQFGASSLALGMLITTIATTLLNIKYLPKIKYKKNESLYLIVFLVAALISSMFSYLNSGLTKPFFSLIAFPLIFFTVFLLTSILAEVTQTTLVKSIGIAFFVITTFGWVEILFSPDILGYSKLNKPVFPFSEESHYALALSPLMASYGILKSSKIKILLIVNSSIQAILFPSLILFVITCMCILIFWGFRRWLTFGTLALLLTVFLTSTINDYSNNEVLAYFYSRLDISIDSNNLTTLVYIQGWDDALQGIISTNGLGLGFQMLGTTSASEIAEVIQTKFGTYKNREDGSFFAAKLIAEFGIFGLFIIYIYLKQAGQYIKISTMSLTQKISFLKCRSDNAEKVTILSTIFFTYIVEIFFRGYGYFSPTLILILSAYFATQRIKQSKRAQPLITHLSASSIGKP